MWPSRDQHWDSIFATVSDKQTLTESAARLGRSEEDGVWLGRCARRAVKLSRSRSPG